MWSGAAAGSASRRTEIGSSTTSGRCATSSRPSPRKAAGRSGTRCRNPISFDRETGFLKETRFLWFLSGLVLSRLRRLSSEAEHAQRRVEDVRVIGVHKGEQPGARQQNEQAAAAGQEPAAPPTTTLLGGHGLYRRRSDRRWHSARRRRGGRPGSRRGA